MMTAMNIAKHLFQTGLKEEFKLPVIVDFNLKEGAVDVCMMRQTTLDEFYGEEIGEPLWTEVIITLSPKIMSDPDALFGAYTDAREQIRKALEKGRVWP